MPGFTLNRLRCQSSLKAFIVADRQWSRAYKAHIAAKTLSNCGSSSMLVLRRNFPIGVMRGSFLILNTGPVASLSFSKRKEAFLRLEPSFET